MKINPFISHPPGSQDNATKRQFDELQQSIQQIAADFTFWDGAYNGGCHEKGAIVTDDGFQMVALRDTCDKPAPQPVGDPAYLYQGADPTDTFLASTLTVGNEYTFTVAQYITGYRFYTVAGNVYTLWFRNASGLVNQVAILTAEETGWQEVSTNPIIVASGTTVALAVTVQEPDPTPTTFTLSYDYQTPQNPAVPGVGQIQHSRSTPVQFDINKTDQNGDQSAQLATLDVGDVIDSQNVRWSIQAIADMGAYYSYQVAPAVNGAPLGVQDFTFETVTATPITTIVDPDYFASNLEVQPFYEVDGGGYVLTQDGYGIDIQTQQLEASDDWEVMSYTAESGGSSGGGGGDGPTLYEYHHPSAGSDHAISWRYFGETFECWGRDTAGNSFTANFPVTYDTVPSCVATAQNTVSGGRHAVIRSLSTTSVNIQGRNDSGNTASTGVRWYAIGKYTGPPPEIP